MNEIVYGEKVIKYEIDRSKRKNMYIVIQEGKVIAKVPNHMTKIKIQETMEQRKEWIYKKVIQYKGKKVNFIDGDCIKIKGEDYTLQVIHTNGLAKAKLVVDESIIYMYLPNDLENEKETIKKEIEKYYFKIAEKDIPKIMEEMTKEVGLSPKTYKVKRLKKVWGNCSSTKNISLNVNLVKYSTKAIKYVILHEICHLKYMNHSKSFWKMVETYMSDYKLAEEELKS